MVFSFPNFVSPAALYRDTRLWKVRARVQWSIRPCSWSPLSSIMEWSGTGFVMQMANGWP